MRILSIEYKESTAYSSSKADNGTREFYLKALKNPTFFGALF